MQRLDFGRGEGERVAEGLSAHSVAGDEDERRGALLSGRGEGASKLRHDEGVVPFGRATERDGAALMRGGGRRTRGPSPRFVP